MCIINEGDIERLIWPLSVAKVNGIGPKSQIKLTQLGIHTIGDIARADPTLLQDVFGLSYAQWLKEVSQGIDHRPVILSSDPKSMSRERTFERDLHVQHDRQALSAVLERICQRLEQDLREKSFRAHTIGIKLRFDDFSILTRDLTLERPVVHSEDILYAARQNLRRTNIRHRRLRLVGVRATKLLAEAGCIVFDNTPQQLNLDGLF